MKRFNSLIAGGAILLFSLSACDKETGKTGSSVDRADLLTNYADKVIIPAYAQLMITADSLADAVDQFNQNPSSSNLQLLRSSWLSAAASLQWVSAFNFGPAESPTGTLLENIGTFPVNELTTESLIDQMGNSGFNPLNNFSRDARGLFGIEYLIFKNNEAQTIAAFTNATAQKRKDYLTAIASDLQSKVRAVSTAWTSYRSTFVAATGTDAGSSTSLLFNEFLMNYELLKNFKLGLPLGLRAGQTAAQPELVEAFYSGYSAELSKLHFQNIYRVYLGNGLNGSEGLGFDDYVRGISMGEALVNETIVKLNEVQLAVQAIPVNPTLSEQTMSSPQLATSAYLKMMELTRYLKSDMSSIMGISITYSSGDGD